MEIKHIEMWGVLWRSKNRLDGMQRHLISKHCMPVLFNTRRNAREWIESEYGYIRNREDLRSEPHGWMMPIPIKVEVRVKEGQDG